MAELGNNKRTAARTREMRARNSRILRGAIGIVLLCIAFALGFAVRDHPGFLQAMGFPSSITGLAPGSTTDPNAEKEANNSLTTRLKEAVDAIEADSLDTYDLEEATQGVVSAFADSTHDPYTRYYTNDRYQALLNSQDEGYAGIGVLFSEHNGIAYAVDVFEGSEAQMAGVQEGDYVVAVGGDSSQGWSRSEVAAVLSQNEGSTVVITWRRPESLEADGGEQFTTTLTCREYDETNVTTEYSQDRHVGYIKVRQFTQNASSLVQTAIGELVSQGAGAFVLDLRDNPGGYLSQAVNLASLFMSSGTVVEVRTVDGVIAKPATGQAATAAPLVVIVNKNTAAAAEVVAAALKESQRATLVGTTTLGKGSVQVLRELSYGGALRYTAAYYLTPEGHDIDGVGVTPAVLIEESQEGDAQKDYAMEFATSLVQQ